MKKNLIQTFVLCCIFTLGIFNVASAQCENFDQPFVYPDYVEICQGESVYLDVTPSYTSYAWSTGETSPGIFVYYGGIYQVTVTDANGCTGTAESNVFDSYLYAYIDITENSGTSDNDGIVCEGDVATLSTMVNGSTGGYQYTWSDGSNSANITVTTSGTYTVTVTDYNGCFTMADVTVTVNSAPTPYVSPSYVELCPGGYAYVEASPGFANYAWSTGETTQYLEVFYAGYYEVTVTDNNGCTGTAAVDVFENYYYAYIDIVENSGANNNDGTICQGDSAILSAMIDPWASGGESYYWSTGETTPTITVSSSGVYYVDIYNEYGCYYQESVSITVSASTDPACQSCVIPTNDSVEMTTTTTAFFDWDDVTDATFYQVKYRLKGTSTWSTIGSSNSQRSVTNLQAKKYYQYKVRAQCADGSWSDYTDVTTFYTSQCDAPTGVASIYLDNTRMRVRWDNNPNEIKAKIRYRVVGTSTWTTQNSANGNNYLYINNLPANATIQYRVRSNCDGNDWSEYAPLMTHDLNAPRLAEETTLENIKFYPNPANEILNLEFNTTNASEVSIVISDNLGRRVLSMNNTYQEGTQKEALDISHLANGYYFLTIYSKDNVETQKFMKMK